MSEKSDIIRLFLLDAKGQIEWFSSLASISITQVITKHPSLLQPHPADVGVRGLDV